MMPERVYERFCKEFPGVVPKIARWFSRRTEKNSIRIILDTGKSLIFTINDDDTWVLERSSR